jgi:hypothetical protein
MRVSWGQVQMYRGYQVYQRLDGTISVYLAGLLEATLFPNGPVTDAKLTELVDSCIDRDVAFRNRIIVIR